MRSGGGCGVPSARLREVTHSTLVIKSVESGASGPRDLVFPLAGARPVLKGQVPHNSSPAASHAESCWASEGLSS